MSFFDELKRRRVFRVAASYAVVAFIIMQLVEILFPMFNFPQWTQQFVVIVVLLGFPIAVILSWVFDKTPQGIIKTDVVDTPVAFSPVQDMPFYKKKRNWFLVMGITAGVLIGRIGGIGGTSEPINEKSIAVLPFENLGNKEEDEYFADGMTEDILTEISKIKDLFVISRTTIMKYKGTNKTLKEIGKELGVANILEGSIRRIGNRVRITGQLIDARNDQHLWAEKYDRDIEDIFKVQDEVATAIANALRIELSDEEVKMISTSQTESVEAYDLYMKGRSLSYSYEIPKIKEAIKYFKEAIKIDPNYALPYAGVTKSRTLQYYFQFMDTELISGALEEAKSYAEKAVSLGPNEAETHFAMGFYLNAVGRYDLAFTSFKNAIFLNPSHAHAHDEIGDVYLYNYGDFNQALSWYDKALKRDPGLVPSKWFGVEIHLRKGQVKRGLYLVDQALINHPNVLQLLTLKHTGLMMAGQYQEAYEFIFSKNEIYTYEKRMLQYYQALGLSFLSLNRMDDLDDVILKYDKIPNANLAHNKEYLRLLKNFKEENFKEVIGGFEALNKSYIVTGRVGERRTLSDVFYYWRAKSFLELGDFHSALKETYRFRAANNESTVSLVLDHYWPKQFYLKGLAYEGLGDERNARESYKDFLKVWSEADDDLPEIIDAKKRLKDLGWAS
jgi:TolB-like protein/Tfp pilus assembly protein PilF